MTDAVPTPNHRRVRARGASRLLAPVLVCAVLAGTGCEDPARPVPRSPGGSLSVLSEPSGAKVLLDGVDIGQRTPAYIEDAAAGTHQVIAFLDTLGFSYQYVAPVVVAVDQAANVSGLLTIACSARDCSEAAAREHSPGDVRFALNGGGELFYFDGLENALIWPAGTVNSYAAAGAAVIAGRIGEDQVALGTYNFGNAANYWVGLPAPAASAVGGDSTFTWRGIIRPRFGIAPTIRGISVRQSVTAPGAEPDVLLVKLVFTNVSDQATYQKLDTTAVAEGYTITDAWIGVSLDPDVGLFTAGDDDLASYDADRGLVFAYDSDFSEAGFSGGYADRPGLIGLAMVDQAGANVRLSVWPKNRDFFAGGAREGSGFDLLTAADLLLPDHPDPRVGFAPDSTPADYLMSVVSGPVTLAPGDSATTTIAVLLAAPAAGTFTSGTRLRAGDPADPTRPLAAVAANLFGLRDRVVAPR